MPVLLPLRAGGGGPHPPGGAAAADPFGMLGLGGGGMGGLMDLFGAAMGGQLGQMGQQQNRQAQRQAGADAGAGSGAGQQGAGVQEAGAGPAGPQGPVLAGGTVQIDLDMGGMGMGMPPGGLGGLINNMLNSLAAGGGVPMQQQQQPGGGGAAAGAQGQQPGVQGQGARPESVLSLLLPALTAVAGSIAAAVMQSLAGRGVQPPMVSCRRGRGLRGEGLLDIGTHGPAHW